ncbi:phage holin [Bacillus zhangzhouensis]|uniref:Holin n=1 Tax=Bacillus zhangzhouensis TaxID=1178540 RepID=A0A081L690_9BACI|nr:phage holin [Bacillus zhangzhouensis]KEP24766.1 hypothetical protein BA70_18380 [Bacillus zhangzhouensis]
MKNLDKGTVIRTVLLFIALINQGLIMFGKPVLPISEDQVKTLTDTLYLAGSMIDNPCRWFKNNYVTSKGQQEEKD